MIANFLYLLLTDVKTHAVQSNYLTQNIPNTVNPNITTDFEVSCAIPLFHRNLTPVSLSSRNPLKEDGVTRPNFVPWEKRPEGKENEGEGERFGRNSTIHAEESGGSGGVQ